MRGRTHLQQLLSPLRFWDVDYAGRTVYTRIVPAGVAVLAGVLFVRVPADRDHQDRSIVIT